MTSPQIQLDEYFRRIRYDGAREPTLDVLREIVLAHSRAIPFENLNPLLRWPVKLDLASLESKLIHGERGGYCFEQNSLLRHALTALGFAVEGLVARVLWNQPPDTITARSHMVLLITHGGRRYTADVGFGAVSPTAPLLLEPGTVQATPNEPCRYVEDGGEWTLEVQTGEEWRRVYRFALEPQEQVDYEVANWYTSTHPSSHFLHTLVAAKAAPGCRYTLRNDQFAIHHADGRTERRTLSSVAEIRDVLSSVFGLRLPAVPELDRTLERLPGSPSL